MGTPSEMMEGKPLQEAPQKWYKREWWAKMRGRPRKTLDEIIEILRQHREELERRFKVCELGVFGSYVRGEAKRGSDLDILVTFREPIGLFAFLDLEEYLEEITGVKVDLVSKKALKPKIGERILKEVVYV